VEQSAGRVKEDRDQEERDRARIEHAVNRIPSDFDCTAPSPEYYQIEGGTQRGSRDKGRQA
jgi:hypothetical protein